MSRRTITITVVAVCLLAVGAGALAWVLAQDPPQAAVVRGDPSSAVYKPIATRALDPSPLTVPEVFTAARVTSGRGGAGVVTMNRGRTEALADCEEAVWGEVVTTAVAGCTQALRGGYTTPDGRVAGQFVIFNLADASAADRLVAALAGRTGGFVRLAAGMPGGFDPTHSRAHAQALGHYVTVSWTAPAAEGAPADLTRHLLALDTLGQAVQNRVVAAV
ncbi:hypothetical protein [Spongiactinospora sp. TRM90649]|uniref:hypothetical protein n=1 Tax=Spongiactinospora sp. TRM90649 TaxID=3031114 RepID=UPI0023F8E6C8|nr:hypothetical protein [Spongiactinospora sp. TRM90649]MDF5755974.1 hypothetical protein [Spongiactinospora sp. TRM90649]